jgi:hypothetical protein
MKKVFLLSGFLLSALSLMAQNQYQPNHQPESSTEKGRAITDHILALQVAKVNTANKPTTTKQRVITQAVSYNNHDIWDSTTYKYTGARTSTYNFNGIRKFEYNTSFQSDYWPTYLTTINPSNSFLEADSILTYAQGAINRIWYAHHASDNKVDSFFYQTLPAVNDNALKIKYTYNNQGLLIEMVDFSNYYNPPAFDTFQVAKYFYNAAGTQLQADTLYQDINGILQPYQSDSYHYNMQNLIDSINSYSLGVTILYSRSLTTFKYSSDTLLKNINVFNYGATNTLANVETDTFGYAGTGGYYSYYNSVIVDLTDSSMEETKIEKTFGTNNLPDSVKIQAYNQYGIYEDIFYKYSYNNYNNPVTIIGTDMMGTYHSSLYNFYYETFDDAATAINNIKNNKDFSIYPNPFDNKLNIDWKGAKANQTKITLVNVLGQTVYSSNQNLITGTNSISIPNLIKGNYVLLIQDAKGDTWKSQLVKN